MEYFAMSVEAVLSVLGYVLFLILFMGTLVMGFVGGLIPWFAFAYQWLLPAVMVLVIIKLIVIPLPFLAEGVGTIIGHLFTIPVILIPVFALVGDAAMEVIIWASNIVAGGWDWLFAWGEWLLSWALSWALSWINNAALWISNVALWISNVALWVSGAVFNVSSMVFDWALTIAGWVSTAVFMAIDSALAGIINAIDFQLAALSDTFWSFLSEGKVFFLGIVLFLAIRIALDWAYAILYFLRPLWTQWRIGGWVIKMLITCFSLVFYLDAKAIKFSITWNPDEEQWKISKRE